MELSVVIPAYNEEKKIRQTIGDINDRLTDKSVSHEIIVVVNGSNDRTASIVQESMKDFPGLKLINLPAGGKGRAVKTGMLKAQGNYRLFMDADNSTPITYFFDALVYLKNGYDVVIASIRQKNSHIVGKEMFYKRFFGWGSNMVSQILILPGIKDTQRGFKIFSAKASDDIFNRVGIIGWGFDMEVLAIARHLGYRIKEIPIIWKNDPNSRVKIWAYPKTLMDTLKIRWNLWTGKYNFPKKETVNI